MDDNGPGGSPGDTLASDTLDYDGGWGWYGTEIDPPVEITGGGGFYIAFISGDSWNPYIGYDWDPPFSLQGWEYWAGSGWRPFSESYYSDIGIRCEIEPWHLPDVMVRIDEFQRITVRGASGVTPANASLDFAVTFANTTGESVEREWWIDVYRGANLIYHLPQAGAHTLSLAPGEEVERIYGLPVPSGVEPGEDYRLYVRVGQYPAAEHEDSFPFRVMARGLQ